MRFFFFYGTLIAGHDNPATRAVHARLRDIGPGCVRGSLWAIPEAQGWYPALVLGEGEVHGRLYEAAPEFGTEDLARLDDWEEFRPGNPGASVYLREECEVTSQAGTVAAQAYRYSRPLPEGARPIPHGDFLRWLAEGGRRALSG